MANPTVEEHLDRIARDGFTIVENAIEPDLLAAVDEDLLRLERELRVRPARNDFEGRETIRIYNLLARGKLYERIPVHERILPIVEGVLDEGCLGSFSSESLLL